MRAAPRRSIEKSNAQFTKALKRLPLGVASTFRYWGDDRTIYVDHGKGGRIWDIDGNRYVDYRLGYGPAILGYADDRVDAAARRGMEVGGVFALSTERELAVADRIAKMVPGGRSRALLQFRDRGGHGGPAPRPCPYRARQLPPDRRRLSRALRRGDVDGQCRGMGAAEAAAIPRSWPIHRAFRRNCGRSPILCQ